MEITDIFKSMLLVMLFYSFAINVIVYAMPADTRNYVSIYSDLANDVDFYNTTNQIQDSLEKQTQIPILEVGALVFYSGNILIDLLLNFAFAIPEMIGLVIHGIMFLFNIDSGLFAIVEIFASVTVLILYFIGLIQLIVGIRSGRIT